MANQVKRIAVPETPPSPEVNSQGIKIYPTSFLPAKAPMEESRVPTTKLDNFHIEVIHIFLFTSIMLGLFLVQWLNARKTNRD